MRNVFVDSACCRPAKDARIDERKLLSFSLAEGEGMKRRVLVAAASLALGACAQFSLVPNTEALNTPNVTAADCSAKGQQLDPATAQCVAPPVKPRIRARSAPPTPSTAALNAVEPGAEIDDSLRGETKLLSGLVGLVRANGYRCNAVSGVKPFSGGNGFKLSCDRFGYTYSIERRDGAWAVAAQ
jgi:hypothetical protein